MESKDDIIADLRAFVEKQAKQIAAQAKQIAALTQEVAIPNQPQLGSDETSFKDNGKKNWVWCISSAVMTVFHIASSRSRKVLEELVGDDFKGYLNFDYFSANCSFAWNYDIKAQYCWAHLIRDIRFLLKHPDKKTRDWAEQLLDRSRRLFSAWHSREEMTPQGFEFSMNLHRDRFLAVVRNVPRSTEYLHASIEAKLSGSAAPSLIH